MPNWQKLPKKHEFKGFHTWGSTSTKTTHSNVYVQHVQCPCRHAFAVLHRLTKSPYPPSYNLNISPSRRHNLTMPISPSHLHPLAVTISPSLSCCHLRPPRQCGRPKCSSIKGGKEKEGRRRNSLSWGKVQGKQNWRRKLYINFSDVIEIKIKKPRVRSAPDGSDNNTLAIQ